MKTILIIFFMGLTLWGCSSTRDETDLSPKEKGDLAYSRREYEKAGNIWEKAYFKNQKDISLIKRLGDCYLKLGRVERAKLFFKNAVDIDPDNIDIQIKLAQIYMLTGNLPEADKIAESLKEKQVIHPELDLIRADIHLLAGRFDQAENLYRKAVISSKDSLRALMKLAIFLKHVNRKEESVEILNIVKKNGIKSARIYLLMTDYFLLDNQYAMAEQSILDAIRIEPEDNSLKYHLVQFYIAEKNHAKAEALLENLVENQDDRYLRMILADLYIINNKFDKAEKMIQKIKTEINEPTIEFELLQGKFWLYTGRSVYATSHLKSALEIKPGLVNARYLLGLTHLVNEKAKLSENSLMQTLQIQPNHYRALLLISELLYKKKEYELSLNYLDRLVENYPEDFTGYLIKGLNLLGLKEYALAKNEFIKSANLSSKKYISYYYLGMVEESMHNDGAAREYYEKVLDIHPDLIDASYRYCMLLLKMKQNKTANAFINKKLSAENKSPEVYYLAAKAALQSGQSLKGESFLKKAIQFESVPGYIYMELTDFYEKNQKLQEAIDTLKQCTHKKPDFQDAWTALCHLYVLSNDLKTALEIMQAGYENFQEVPIFQSNLAWLLLENDQDINKALSLAQSAYEKKPENIGFADTLAWAYYHKGVYSQVIWLLSEVEKRAPDNGFVRYHLGMTYYRQGEMEKATKYLKIAQKSVESKYFSGKIDLAFSEMLSSKQVESKNKPLFDEKSILSSPEDNIIDDTTIIPQWGKKSVE